MLFQYVTCYVIALWFVLCVRVTFVYLFLCVSSFICLVSLAHFTDSFLFYDMLFTITEIIWWDAGGSTKLLNPVIFNMK